jgi:His-Xaa-Ser system protein HxsD
VTDSSPAGDDADRGESSSRFAIHEGGGVLVRMQIALYGRDAILKAAHRFTDRCSVHLEETTDGEILCQFQVQGDPAAAEPFVAAFVNEALDQSLRAKLAEQTEPIRRLLLAQAFSRHNLIHPDFDSAQLSEDPHRVSLPDNEKHIADASKRLAQNE